MKDGTVEQEVDVEKLRSLAKQRLGDELEGVGQLAELVGLGNIGAVYRVARPSGEPVAAKVMHEHIKENGSLQDRFLREATILDQADHPSSIKVYGTGETEHGEAYFVMEYLEGRPLRQLAEKLDDFPVDRSLQITEQALDCLEAYHRADVLHRDLKPANLFVTREGVVKLLDFGLARFRTEDRDPTQAGTAMGTPAYMAPEQALGHQDEIDERTDVFGMGAVLYKLLSGRTIHDIDSVQATLVQAATSQPDPLETHAPEVPAPVAELVDRAVARAREDRFQSAAEMRDAVREALDLIRDGADESLDDEGSVADLTGEELADDAVDQPAEEDLQSDDFLPEDSSSAGSSIGEASSAEAASAESPELDPADGGSPIGREPGETTPDEALARSMDSETGVSLSEESEPSEAGDAVSSTEAPDDDPSIVMEADELEGLLGEADEDPPDEDPASEPDPPDLTPELQRMLQAVRSDKADGDFLRAMNETLDTLREARGEGVRRVAWQIHPHGFEADGGEYHAFDGDLSDLPQTLQAAGFHRLMVETSVDEDELSMFVQWLGTDTRSTLPGEDDLATRFRELQLSSIGAGIYPVFRWDDRGDASFEEPAAHARLADRATSYLHGTEGSWQGLETLADEAGAAGGSAGPPAPTASISSRLVSHADDFLRTPKGVLSLDVASALDNAIGADQHGGSHQLGALFAEIWNEEPSGLERPTGAVRELFASYVDRELGRQLVEVLGTACRKIDQTDDRRAFVAAAVDHVEVERLIEVVDQTIDREDADRDKLARLLARIAEEFPASRRAEIIATYEFGDDFTRRILRPYRQRFEVSEGGNIETAEAAADSTPGPDGDQGADEAVRSGESVDWRRAFAGEIYRLFRVAVFEETDARTREKFTGEFLNRLGKLFQLAPDLLSILFTDDRILVNGLPLKGSASSYKALRSVADFLDRFDCNHLSFEQGVGEADIDALLELLHRMSEGTGELEAPFEPGSRIRLEQTDPAVRYGMVEPLVGDEPIETRMGEYYAACVTTLRQFARTSPEERTEWLAPLKRMSQTWVRLSGRSRASTLALTGLGETGADPAAIVLDSTLLSILMARRLTGRADALRRIGFAALAVDFLGPNRDDRMTRWKSAAQCAAAILANARTDDDTLRRAVTAFEIGRRFDNDPRELPYDDETPKVETLLVGIAREYTAMAAGLGAEADATPREIVESISKSKTLRVERYLLHLLVDTLGLFTRGMPVELSSRWRGVVLSANDHVTDFHLPRVRLVRNPDGERVSPTDVDLAEELAGGEYGYVVRRLEDIDSEEASNIEDSMTDSMRRS